MTQGNSEQHASEQEPISVVDKRKIDPETGEVREGAAEDAAPEGGNGTAPEAAPVTGDGGRELAERTADLQRLTAEYANYRKRVERDRKAAVDAAKAAVVTELLGVLDDLDRAKAHGDLESGPLKSVADKLVDALRKQGLEEFGAEGEPFDPTLHEAVQHEGSGHDPVLGVVMRKGYRFGDRVLRHALVGVTDGVADLAETPETAETEASDADASADSH
ncbi:nucleotide exchange factor GrpE [Nocardia puris]|uniref:Protein GrpE n=1 Tax=Nocardia puris TaxID=208602 RepID=A0A366DEH6_9NOCA|nr:nucleotide exchange factor GrpE [Nocardia puris]MBF6214952.1 nucleotide exchange factor GrpE [Nocardia puris]MBF6364796.1 nucleotide exchange factor GrpE [Nocardia puris]MBF6460237.1 nucleotide exchange factor GrpE [Nocardia puris]RBO87919.1 molecular chaperone GrpE [Nocardia puris]